MKPLFSSLLASSLLLPQLSAETPAASPADQLPTPASASGATELVGEASEDILDSFVRVNSTIQTFNAGQPWQRNNPQRRSGLGTLISPREILTAAELVANQTYLELESADSSQSVQAEVIAIDYKANLALLAPIGDAGFLQKKTPLQLGSPAHIGDSVSVWQVESNGTTLRTRATIRAVDTAASFLSGYSFLTYVVKGSMQSASSSFTLPVTKGHRLLGVLTSYDSEDQISEVIPPEIIATFLRDARDGSYEGFPVLGVAITRTEDKSFRDYLGLPSDGGGLYLSKVKADSPAGRAGLQLGDVLLAIDEHQLDRRGYFEHPSYGPLPWSVLIRSTKTVGDQLSLTILRDGKEEVITATLEAAPEPLVPRHLNDSPPTFLIKGGLVFQELSREYLEAHGDNWTTRAPLDLMHAMENPEDYEEERESIVFLSRVLPNPATIGYDRLHGLIVNQANGQAVRNLRDLADALTAIPTDGIHRIGLDEAPGTLYLDAALSDQVDQQFLRQGLPSLSRLPEKSVPPVPQTPNE
ncbi:PDZ domain-containing protein [Roseibacillus ishigakijimensis]|uniref:PDZ domain-containing protein n=1 Tax=Roseibacillus ishigakijimensis TaxID=454146 RepID=A0A934VNQ3_9BACT|nr:PDZ domain-containing protein [Roseibacillus ishigakijimensis]MBK1835265.1 PDZ domain-containing protein [Roseibacillus ishigakijimensis]